MQSARVSRGRCPADLTQPFPEGALSRRLKACSVVAYSESTLLRLPFTGVYAPKETGVTSVSLKPEDALVSGPDRRWTVRSAGLTLPGTFARRVFRALEWIAIDGSIVLGKPFSNPILVSPRDICERLCWHPHQLQLEAIETAIRALADIDIVAASPAPVTRSSPPADRMGLLSSVSLGIVKSAGGKVSFSNFKVSFDERFVESINNGRIVALNWTLWNALPDPVAQRLMEILESESARHPDSPAIAMSRESLYRLIPMSPATSRKGRQDLLDQAQQELIAAEYLKHVGSPASVARDLVLFEPGSAWHSLHLQPRPKPAVNRYQRMMDGLSQAKTGSFAFPHSFSTPAVRRA